MMTLTRGAVSALAATFVAVLMGTHAGVAQDGAASLDNATMEDTATEQEATVPAAELSVEERDAILGRGRATFVSACSSCHAVDGSGDVGPPLIENPLLGDTEAVAETIVHGFNYMPPLGDVLDDEQVAAVMTYIRSNWGNDYGPVNAREVATVR